MSGNGVNTTNQTSGSTSESLTEGGILNATVTNNATVNGGTVNIQNPNFSINASAKALNNLAASVSATGGATLAYRVMKAAPTPLGKLTAGVATLGTVQATTYLMSKILNEDISDANSNGTNMSNSSTTHNFISNVIRFPSVTREDDININDSISPTNKGINFPLSNEDKKEILSHYPFNLLIEVNQFISIEILILYLFFNLFLVKKFSEFNYSKYLPNNKIGIFIDFAIKRYIKVWKISSKFLFSLAWFLLVFNIFMTKIAIYHIIN